MYQHSQQVPQQVPPAMCTQLLQQGLRKLLLLVQQQQQHQGQMLQKHQ
jgi:hypothetical protein